VSAGGDEDAEQGAWAAARTDATGGDEEDEEDDQAAEARAVSAGVDVDDEDGDKAAAAALPFLQAARAAPAGRLRLLPPRRLAALRVVLLPRSVSRRPPPRSRPLLLAVLLTMMVPGTVVAWGWVAEAQISRGPLDVCRVGCGGDGAGLAHRRRLACLPECRVAATSGPLKGRCRRHGAAKVAAAHVPCRR